MSSSVTHDSIARCTQYTIPSDVWDLFNDNEDEGKHWSEIWNEFDKYEIEEIIRKYAPGIKRGDLVHFEKEGGFRQASTFVYDGTELVQFRGEDSVGDYPSLPCVGISIDEFPTVDYYADAGFYNDIVWLDITGYVVHPDKRSDGKTLLVNKEKKRSFLISSSEGSELTDITDLGEHAPFVPYFREWSNCLSIGVISDV